MSALTDRFSGKRYSEMWINRNRKDEKQMGLFEIKTDKKIKRSRARHMKKDFLYKIAENIWEQRIKKDRSGRWYSKQVGENLEKLYPFMGKEKEHTHYIEKIRISLMICLIGILLAAALGMSETLQPLVKENRIERRGYNGGTRQIPLEVSTDGKNKYRFELEVRERMYDKEQLKKLYESAKEELQTAILGENESLEHVESDLNLVGSLPGYPFRIEWESGNYDLIDAEGKLRKEAMPEAGEQVEIKAVFSYEDFQAEYLFYIRIEKKMLTEEEEKAQKLFEAAKSAEAASRESETVVLPTEAEGEKLLWKSEKSNMWMGIFFLAVCAAGLTYFQKDEQLKEEIKKREAQMRLAYPEIVSRLSVYLEAGLPLKAAWEKICADYEKGKADREKNAVYEEMNIACQEMKSGISEMRAYEQFGNRCGIPIYRKFSALLTQNVRKGSTKLGSLLKEESRIAFEERKNAARKAGEEAGTKLLLPMMMMLCVVMLMILLPAFMTF